MKYKLNLSTGAMHTKQWVMPYSEKCIVTSVSTSLWFGFFFVPLLPHIARSKFMFHWLELPCL